MVRNYLLIALRSLRKNRSHALVNVLGLALGITCSIVIFLIVRFELSYDNFHADVERIYRIVTTYTKSSTPGYNSGITYPLPDALRQDFQELENVTIVDNYFEAVVISIPRKDDSIDRFKESSAAFVDPEYLEIFKYEWIAGNRTALQREKTAVLTSSLAKK